MKTTLHLTCLGASALALLLGACSQVPGPPQAVRSIDFVEDIKPILTNQCLPCHNNQVNFGRFSMETEDKALLRTKDPGPFIVPGFPEGSRLWQVVTQAHGERQGEDRMPMNGPRLTEEEKQALYQWIEQGAPWPDGEPGHLRTIAEPNQA